MEERASKTSKQKTRKERDRDHTALARASETSEQRQAKQKIYRDHPPFARSLETKTTYKSKDTVVNNDISVNYPTEFLNSLDLPGMPMHILSLKIGYPIILLRNINPSRLCNGTRLSVKNIYE
ncbi:hypothetical protein LAZ67_1001642 [Cordylochernes scorpioides]|uniref:DNA helicase Pif1-like 2B domain-containing protein n=1 Tax=Cordylochernes scorpioides TaxID=51811 RepID=A0ABY6JVP6_9ARAC|nr:hypothetical protein LAZ67_1001642 [Cordylochernes scorpioides]